MNQRDDIISTIRYALWRAPNYRKIRRRDDDLDLEVTAKHVLEHLELCRYRITKLPKRRTDTRTDEPRFPLDSPVADMLSSNDPSAE